MYRTKFYMFAICMEINDSDKGVGVGCNGKLKLLCLAWILNEFYCVIITNYKGDHSIPMISLKKAPSAMVKVGKIWPAHHFIPRL